MIIYLDTSSLVKLYVQETDSDNVKSLINSAEVITTSIVAYPESRAAFARKLRSGVMSDEEYQKIKTTFDEQWKNYIVIRLNDGLSRQAGDLAEKHNLKGLDSIHLASYLYLKDLLNIEVRFSSFDEKLNKAEEIERDQLS